MITIEEILSAAQKLTHEQRKQLIQELFLQMPKSNGLSGSVTWVGDLEKGKETLRELVGQSLQHTANQLRQDENGGE
ncbi:MAG TPA: hypothetical protein VEF04_20145 [Blastocatellia bacterium]|nr:hypothetical protein [Blastocatellia bacterium]